MPRLDKVNVEVRGHKADVIVMTLNYFSIRSSTARTLLQQAAANNLVITLTNNNSDVQTQSAADVRGDWVACNQNQQELTESLLFEIKNSVNHARQDNLDSAFKKNQVSYLECGTQRALIESESSVALNEILSQVRTGYIPSDFGSKQMDAVAQGNRSPGGFGAFFANCKHKESDTTTKLGLKSKYLYAYECVSKYGGTIPWNRTRFQRCTTRIVTPSRQDILTGDNIGKLPGLFKELAEVFQDPDDHQKLRHALACYILGLGLLVRDRGWSIFWKGNGAAEYYEFATEMLRVDGFPTETGLNIANLIERTFTGDQE